MVNINNGASGYVEGTGVIESESESNIAKRLKRLMRSPQK